MIHAHYRSRKKHTKGFTLVELIIYVAISAIVLTAVLNFAWNIMGSQARVNTSAELTDNGRLVLEKITRDIMEADDAVTGSSIFDIHPGVLVLDRDGDEIMIDTYTESVDIGGVNTNIRKLRRRVNLGDDQDLTSDYINVSNFIVQNYTRATESKNINFEITLEYVNPGDDSNRTHEITLQSSATVRQR